MNIAVIHSVYGLPFGTKLIIFGCGGRGRAFLQDVQKYRPDICEICCVDSAKEGEISGHVILRFDRTQFKTMVEAGFQVVICSAFFQQIIDQIPFVNHVYVFEHCSTRIYDYFNKYEKFAASGKTESDLQRRVEVFLDNVFDVSIEISNYCNRTCSYCPLSMHPERKHEVLMDKSLLDNILSELRSIGYSGDICLNVYNEPTANMPYLLHVLAEIKSRLPQCQIYFSTNGDYLKNADEFRAMFEAGLDRLIVSTHLGRFSTLEAVNRIVERAVRWGLKPAFSQNQDDSYVEATANHKDHPILFTSSNYSHNGMNRGGLLEIPHPSRRQVPCLRVFTQMAIFHDGIVMPCCNFFPDDDRHKKYVCAKQQKLGWWERISPSCLRHFGNNTSTFPRRWSLAILVQMIVMRSLRRRRRKVMICFAANSVSTTLWNSRGPYTYGKRANGISPWLATW